MRITSKVIQVVGAIVAAWRSYFTDRLGEESENQIGIPAMCSSRRSNEPTDHLPVLRVLKAFEDAAC